MELESNDKLNFLDTTITKNPINATSFSLILSIFRKATFTGLGMNFHSSTYYNFKLNNIRTLLHRAYTLCSNWIDFHSEISFLTIFFKTNGYPEHLVQSIINKFLWNKFSPSKIVYEAKKLNIYHKVPFINNQACTYIKKELHKIMSSSFPQINLTLVFCNSTTIQGLTKHKEQLPETLK